jgi:hypothetical protein
MAVIVTSHFGELPEGHFCCLRSVELLSSGSAEILALDGRIDRGLSAVGMALSPKELGVDCEPTAIPAVHVVAMEVPSAPDSMRPRPVSRTWRH